MTKFALAGTVFSLGLIFAGSTAEADEEKIPLKDVPKVVMEAVMTRFPKAEATGAEKVVEKGKTSYEVSLKNSGKTVDVALTAAGKITAIETLLATSDLPKAVAKAVADKYPKGTVKSAEELIEIADGKETKNYEVVVTISAKKAIELTVTPEGKVLSEEDAEDD